jgi:hypothetical protein
MARKFEYGPGRYAWNLETCEEEILIAGYREVCRFIPADHKWKARFEINFFEEGNGVSEDYIEEINAVRRRRGLSLIEIRETGVYDYGRSPDKHLKATQRRQIRDELGNLGEQARRDRSEQAEAEAAVLPPPLHTYEEYKARQAQHKAGTSLSFREVTKRTIAQQTANLPKLPKPLSPDRAARMLTLATPTLWKEIIPKLSGDDALQVAEMIADPELRDALVKHSLVAA